MQSQLNPYLSFKDNAREAMEFYRTIFGGKLDVYHFKEYGIAAGSDEGEKVMHAMLETENGIVFMASDTPESMRHAAGTHMSMSLSGDDEDELTSYFHKLSDGGTVAMPLEKAPWGDIFGMVLDKFGIQWMINIAGKIS